MKSPKLRPSKKLYPVSLGCPKNKSDFEKLLYLFQKRGYTFTLDPEEADILWVNTCAFIKPSVEEAIDHILDLASLKKGSQKLIVSGCLPARYSLETLRELLPEVDEFYGIEPFQFFTKEEPEDKVLTESPFYAYLKISEGCNHRCSYCTIPKIRGSYRSKPIESLLREARNLLEKGIKELILVGQDLTLYGRDLGLKDGLLYLLKELSLLPYEFRIRLLYLHPSHLEEGLLERILELPKVVPYLDIPIQHAHPNLLKAMKRPYSPEKILNLMEHVRKLNPMVSFRTSLIVGFPGEGDKEFAYLLEFLKLAKFEYLGVFPFYPEEGTPAEKLPGQIPMKERLRRKREVLRLQKEITKARLKERVGVEEELLVLGEDFKGRRFGIARLQAPEIDGLTYLLKGSHLPGSLVKVKITRSGVYDLWAVPWDFKG